MPTDKELRRERAWQELEVAKRKGWWSWYRYAFSYDENGEEYPDGNPVWVMNNTLWEWINLYADKIAAQSNILEPCKTEVYPIDEANNLSLAEIISICESTTPDSNGEITWNSFSKRIHAFLTSEPFRETMKSYDLSTLSLRAFIRRDETGKSLMQKCFDRAQIILLQEPYKGTDAEPPTSARRIKSNIPDNVIIPLDKVNDKAWGDLTDAPRDSEGKVMIATEKKSSRCPATVRFRIDIDFDKLEEHGLKLTKHLDEYDKRVYIAISAIFAYNSDTMSIGQINAAMGNKGHPAESQIKKINDSLTKMSMTRLFLDNSQEITVNKNYPVFKYDAPLLPFERVTAYINGQLVDSAIHLFQEPPLMRFARGRRQITTISRKLLEDFPLNQTERNLELEDYLLKRISSINRPGSKQSHKIMLSTIYQKLKIDGKGSKWKKARYELPKKITDCLDAFKKNGIICGYTQEKDSITIIPKKH